MSEPHSSPDVESEPAPSASGRDSMPERHVPTTALVRGWLVVLTLLATLALAAFLLYSLIDAQRI